MIFPDKLLIKVIHYLGLFLFSCLTVISSQLFAEIRVVDGDTIVLDQRKVRLFGIDAPEMFQLCIDSREKRYLCGKRATQELIQLIANTRSNNIECVYNGSDKYGRLLGDCWTDGIYVNSWMVENGWAMAYRQYSKKFVKEEMEAREKKLGIWVGAFVEPWKWRRGIRLSSEVTSMPEGCPIKGNISSSGEKIYHIPDGDYYSRTKISEERGEKWFCSEKEAESAGWRKSRR